LAVCVLVLVAPATALARKPVISYVDESGLLRLYDSELGADVDPPPAVPANFLGFRYSISLNGRYVVFNDPAKKLHLLDRASGTQVDLPGIDVYADPGSLSVADTGLIAFDNGGSGGTVVYDSGSRATVTTGLTSGHRQPRLSGDGRRIATTCDDTASTCVAAYDPGPDPYLWDLPNQLDAGFPHDAGAEELPCINGNGTLVGIDEGLAGAHDIRVFDRSGATPQELPLTDLKDPLKDETNCVLDAGGGYVGLTSTEMGVATFRVYELSSGTFLDLPPDRTFDSRSLLSDAYTPPPSGGPPAPPSGDRVKPVTSRVRMTHRRFRPGRRATAFRFVLSEPAGVRIVIRRVGRYAGQLRRARLGAGAHTIAWTGRLRGRKARPGLCAAVVIATDRAGNLSLPVLKEFRVLRPEGDRRP
jgi:hypothetical protein